MKITGIISGFILSATLYAQADSPVFGNSPTSGTAFDLAFESGNTFGGAVLFTPTANIELSSVTMWLSGFTAGCGVTPSVSIYNSYEIPGNVFELGSQVVSLDTPAANNGSSAAFTFTDSSDITLNAGQQYCLFAYGLGNGTANPGGSICYWDAGTTPIGDAVLNLSDTFVNGGLAEPISEAPAFSLNSDAPNLNAVPEPSALSLLLIPALLGIGRLYYNRQKAEAKKFVPVKVRVPVKKLRRDF